MEEVTVSTGVVFKVKAVPLNAFDLVRRKCMVTKPKVPVVHIPDKDRDEPNPNNPDYIDEKNEWESLYAEKTMDMGVESLIQHMNKQWLPLFRKKPK